MIRNPEVQIVIVVMCVISLVAIGMASFFSFTTTVIVSISLILLICTSLLFTKWRYRELERLSEILREISAGNTSLDVRDNYEGELSILKNEIYKVTRILSEQGTVLQEDKLKLTNAISDISHQLKTPITSMMVMADLLSDTELPTDKRMEFTRNIRIQLERIEWLVSSLLKLSKIDAGTAHFKKNRVMVDKLIQKALAPILMAVDIKEQTVTVQGDDFISFIGDLNWTAEAVINILKNCVEHTPNGGTLSITYAENALFTEIVIKDNGKGIPKEDLPYIFRRFYKGKNASDESVGIGLAMAHSIITSQNGTIDVSSEQEWGTRFHIKFYKQII